MNPNGTQKQQLYRDIGDILFRAGFATIFLVNAVVAVVEPEGFRSIIEENLVGQYLPELAVTLSLGIVAINDLVLGLFILTGKRRGLVYAWAGLWLLVVAGLKIMNLIWSVA